MATRWLNFENFFPDTQTWFDNMSRDLWDRWGDGGEEIANRYRRDFEGIVEAYKTTHANAAAALAASTARGEQELRLGRGRTLETIERAGQASGRMAQGNLASRGLAGSTVATNVDAGIRERTALTKGRVEEDWASTLADYIFRGGVVNAEFADRGGRFAAGLESQGATGAADIASRFKFGQLQSYGDSRGMYASRRFATPIGEVYTDPWKEMRDAALRQLAKAGTQAGMSLASSGFGGGM